MRRAAALVAACLLTVAGCIIARNVSAQSHLQITYGDSGIQTLRYGNQVLEDVQLYPSDAFHIWHMKTTSLQGAVLNQGDQGWGEAKQSRTWDAAAKTWTYHFSWGTIRVGFVQNGDTLNMNVTEINNAGSGLILDGASIYPLALHFPSLPTGFNNPAYSQLAFNTTSPSVTVADYGTGAVAAVVPDASKPLYSGFQTTGNTPVYTALISSTTPDGLATFQPHNDRSVAPGQQDSFTVSLRFAPSGTDPAVLGKDAYQNWAKTWPSQLNWTDRRIIGTVYLATSAQGDSSVAAGFPNNPRRYFNTGSSLDFDIRTSDGLALFQAAILKKAADIATNLRRLNAQGAITWDIEGEEYPMSTSYVCSPDQIGSVAPEMESSIALPGSPYAGMHLVDAYFKIIRDAGFRVGVCVRPQRFAIDASHRATQTTLQNTGDVTDELIRKMKYAHNRWGATLFYIDSSVDANGAALDASIFQKAGAALPDSLLVPEWSTPKYYAYTAPFLTFLFHGDLGTNPTVYNVYPHAFSVNLVNDVDSKTLAAHASELTASVRRGDILMVHADYWQTNNPTVVQMYLDAGTAAAQNGGSTTNSGSTTDSSGGATSSTPVTSAGTGSTTTTGTTNTGTTAPTTTTPSAPAATAALNIAWPVANDVVSGMVNILGTIPASLDAAGSYLIVDGTEIGTRRVTTAPYSYALDTTTLANGVHTLQLWAHDMGNSTLLSAPVTVSVLNTAPASAPVSTPVNSTPTATYPIMLTYPLNGQAVSGTVVATGAISQPLDAAGSMLLVDGRPVGTARVSSAPWQYPLDTAALSVGAHALQLWAHDIGNNTLLSNTVNILVSH